MSICCRIHNHCHCHTIRHSNTFEYRCNVSCTYHICRILQSFHADAVRCSLIATHTHTHSHTHASPFELQLAYIIAWRWTAVCVCVWESTVRCPLFVCSVRSKWHWWPILSWERPYTNVKRHIKKKKTWNDALHFMLCDTNGMLGCKQKHRSKEKKKSYDHHYSAHFSSSSPCDLLGK